MSVVAHVLLDLGASVYAGLVVGFAILLAVQPRLAGRPRAEIARVWRSAGPVVGLSMGGWVAGLVVDRFVTTGTFAFGWGDAAARLDLATWLVFGVLWVSSFICEIWTMDPLRTTVDADGIVADAAGFDRGYDATVRHVGVNAALVVAWHVLRQLA